MKQLFGSLFFLAACASGWGLVFALAACAARHIGILPAVGITAVCLGAILAFFWHETKVAK
jgi:hypothetical protein